MCNDPYKDSYYIFFPLLTAVSAWSCWCFDDAPDIIFNLLENVAAEYAELIATALWSI